MNAVSALSLSSHSLPLYPSLNLSLPLSLSLQVIAAAGTDEKCELAVEKGAVAAINYTTQSVKEEVKKITGNKGVDVVFDAVGGDIFKEAFNRYFHHHQIACGTDY